MKQSKTPLWKKSCLDHLRCGDVLDYLWEISDDGDYYGYERGDTGYYQEYKENFDELAAGAYDLAESIQNLSDLYGYGDDASVWDDVLVAVLGDVKYVLGYDGGQYDYFAMTSVYDEDAAVTEAKKRLMRLTKENLLDTVSKVMQCVSLFWDIKASHDCLVSIVDELDDRAAAMANGETSDRMWVE